MKPFRFESTNFLSVFIKAPELTESPRGIYFFPASIRERFIRWSLTFSFLKKRSHRVFVRVQSIKAGEEERFLSRLNSILLAGSVQSFLSNLSWGSRLIKTFANWSRFGFVEWATIKKSGVDWVQRESGSGTFLIHCTISFKLHWNSKLLRRGDCLNFSGIVLLDDD